MRADVCRRCWHAAARLGFPAGRMNLPLVGGLAMRTDATSNSTVEENPKEAKERQLLRIKLKKAGETWLSFLISALIFLTFLDGRFPPSNRADEWP